VKLGLDALRKSFGLSDDQFDALCKFAGAEAILNRDPLAATSGTPTPAAPTPAAPPKPAPAADTSAEDAKKAEVAAKEKAAEEAKKAEQAKKADEAAKAKAAEETKKAEEAKKADEAAKAKAEEEAKKAAAKPASKPAAAPAEGMAVAALKTETTSLADRASKVPADSYKVQYSGAIRKTALGDRDTIIEVGGASTLPFHLFEGDMPQGTLIAMEVPDAKPDEWPETLTRHFSDVLDNPVGWAQKCVNEYQAESLCVSLASTDPNGMNRPSAEAAKTAADVINAVDVPIIVWGCGNAEKDTESLREITAMIGDRKVCLAPLTDANYRSLGATAMAFQHPMVAGSPIDVNLAKQLNILLENLGVSLESVLIDPSIGALGYGIEYTYSVMERIRLAALTQKDEKLQVPFICNLGREVWKAKECRLPTDDLIGDQENRGVLMEAVTATCMLMAGGEVLVMR
ncbi:MAG: acetyl-CoA decarbonylase/synthase complex subunit delta, partial [Desulfobulbaceae bacterium]|nr:acetyl-CoA decarbonylase/synthase complex subunit delta [Desulfobulbaceae bacterium]